MTMTDEEFKKHSERDYQELLREIWDAGLTDRLMRAGHFRGLFDTLCDEYRRASLEEKTRIFKEILINSRFGAEEILRRVKLFHKLRGRPDIAHAMNEGVVIMFERELLGFRKSICMAPQDGKDVP